MLAAGSLNTQITIQRDTVTRTKGAVSARTPATIDVCWALQRCLRGTESYKGHRVASEVDYGYTIRGIRRDIKASDRIIIGTRTLEIIGPPLPHEADQETVLLAREINAQ